jgi:N-glycosylase/DNA lyase
VATLLPAPAFDLGRTLESGQFFRFAPAGGGAYYVHAAGRLLRARQEGDHLRIEGAPASFARRFFALDHDGDAVALALGRDPALRPALNAVPGLRILRQDPWECTAAFIVSICSNIPRIARTIEALARTWGRPVRLGGFESHAFPAPDALGDERALRRLGLGFRAPYLVETARRAAAGFLEGLDRLTYDAARERLMELPGVAEKVADCVLLFAYGRLEAFPVDTRIRQAMRSLFFRRRAAPDREIRAFARERWGPLAGYAQQYLYAWWPRVRRGISSPTPPVAAPA